MVLATVLAFSACSDNVNSNLEESLELFAGLEEIPEASNTSVTVNRATGESNGWFQIEITNTENNPFISNGTYEAYCLEWKKTLRSNNDTHQGVKWFATNSNDKWKPLNYFFSLREGLRSDYPNLTNREVQAVVWVLAGHMEIAPEFDVLSLAVDELPSRLRSNGAVNINRERVAEIASKVINEYDTATIPTSGTVGQTASDEQDIFVPPNPNMVFKFTGPVFDITAQPNGSILVADFATIKEIRNNGVHEIISLPTIEGPDAFGASAVTPINGLSSIGGGSFFASRGGLDSALGAALFSASSGNSKIIGDIETYTLGDWPDGDPGQAPDWIDFRCEPPGGYTAGPQTNPYHLMALSGSEVLLADAAGNTLLYIKKNGTIEIVATFDPINDPDTGIPLVQFPLEDGTECPVEPVPTSVAVGDDGAYYVGELTGTTAENLAGSASPEGLASVWRIESGSRDITCPSDNCTKAVTGLNSVIDLEFGPDGYLYVVEFDKNGFFPAVVFNDLGFGTIKKCDVSADSCEIVEGGLVLPGAITFDKWDNLWLVDNVFDPTIRRVK